MLHHYFWSLNVMKLNVEAAILRSVSELLTNNFVIFEHEE